MTLKEIKELLEKATPGPWKLNRHGYPAVYSPHEFVEAPDEGAICGIWDPDGHPYQGANASLIVAAPELAALLVRAVDGLQVIRDAGGATTPEGLACSGLWCAEQAHTLLLELGVEA
jgi:hypothetical protein